MPRRPLSPLSLFTAALTATLLAACAAGPAPSAAPASAKAAAAAHPNVLDVAAQTPELSTFVKLARDAGLEPALGQAASYTLFAPTNDAFQAVPAKTLEAWQSDKAMLKDVLSYHVLTARMASSAVKTGSAKTLQGASMSTGSTAGYVTVDDAMVVKADLGASNGVIHTVDRVLVPPKK